MDETLTRTTGLRPVRDDLKNQSSMTWHDAGTGRRPVVLLSSFVLCIAMICINFGCTVTVIPPLDPAKPTVVYLCDYGVHSSLLIPVSKHHYVEYLYGDWNYAALCHNHWWNAIGAIFWSQQAVLGRLYITQVDDQEMPTTPDGPKTEVAIIVNGEGCQKVLVEMSARWEKKRATALTADEPANGDFWYVKDDQPYNWLHDCNLNTADSLAEMGCTIRGFAIWSVFKVAGKTE